MTELPETAAEYLRAAAAELRTSAAIGERRATAADVEAPS